MSLQGWFNTFEIVSAVGTISVIVGLVLEYGKGLFDIVAFWKKGIHLAEIEVTTLNKRRGAVFVVLGIVVELLGTAGIAVTSDQIETQHRREITRLTARNIGLLSAGEVDVLTQCLKKAHPKGLIFITGAEFDNRAKNFAGQLGAILNSCEYVAVSPPFGNHLLQFGLGVIVATAGNISPPPPRLLALSDAFKCIGLTLPLAAPTAAVSQLGGDDVLLVVNEGPP